MEKLDQRSIRTKSKSDFAKKLEKAEEYRKLKSHERMHKAEEKEMKLRKAHDFKVQGPMFQKELQNKANALEEKLNKASEQVSQ